MAVPRMKIGILMPDPLGNSYPWDCLAIRGNITVLRIVLVNNSDITGNVPPMLVDAYNAFEVGLWTVLGLAIAIRYRRSGAPLRRTSAIASGLLFLFAISDVIEMQTGAWWRPWPLMVLKGFCLIGLVWSLRQLVRESAGTKVTGRIDKQGTEK